LPRRLSPLLTEGTGSACWGKPFQGVRGGGVFLPGGRRSHAHHDTTLAREPTHSATRRLPGRGNSALVAGLTTLGLPTGEHLDMASS
jgi:hypothetical protein